MNTHEPHTRPGDVSREHRLEDLRTRTLPVVVWCVAAGIALAMLLGRTIRNDFIAIAQARTFEISSPVEARIDAVLVGLNDQVRTGDAVVTLDDGPLRALLAISEAEVQKLRGDLESARVSHRRDVAQVASNRRRFQMDEEDRRLNVLSLRIEVEGGEVEAERTGIEARRAQELLQAGLIDQAEADSLRLLHEEVRRRISETRELLARSEEELRVSELRRREFEREEPGLIGEEPALLGLRRAVDVEMRRLDEIQEQRKQLVLRSPVAGQVSQVFLGPGQGVEVGEDILYITAHTVEEIVAYLPERDASRVEARTPVRITRRTGQSRSAESVVLRVGQGIQPLPPRLWSNPQTPVYGRAVVVAPVPAMELVPGELLEVRFFGR